MTMQQEKVVDLCIALKNCDRTFLMPNEYSTTYATLAKTINMPR